MPSFSIDPANPRAPAQIRTELTSFTDELCATVARIFVYVGTLALFTILAIHGWDQLHAVATGDVVAKDLMAKARWSKAGWRVADRSQPAFAISQPDIYAKSITYTIFRHPMGGRRDILRWTGTGEQPVAELEVYRLGREAFSSLSQGADLAARMGLPRGAALETAGVIDSKFGAVTLLHQIGARDAATRHAAGACLGFVKRFDDPGLQISGWSCQDDTLPARRMAIGCMLNRLVLLTSGNEPKLAQLFARAELNRGTCAAAGPPAADWMTGPANPELRGTFEPD